MKLYHRDQHQSRSLSAIITPVLKSAQFLRLALIRAGVKGADIISYLSYIIAKFEAKKYISLFPAHRVTKISLKREAAKIFFGNVK